MITTACPCCPCCGQVITPEVYAECRRRLDEIDATAPEVRTSNQWFTRPGLILICMEWELLQLKQEEAAPA